MPVDRRWLGRVSGVQFPESSAWRVTPFVFLAVAPVRVREAPVHPASSVQLGGFPKPVHGFLGRNPP